MTEEPRSDPILFFIHRLSRSILRASMARYLKEFGLGVPQVQILNAIGARGPLVSKEIAALQAEAEQEAAEDVEVADEAFDAEAL